MAQIKSRNNAVQRQSVKINSTPQAAPKQSKAPSKNPVNNGRVATQKRVTEALERGKNLANYMKVMNVAGGVIDDADPIKDLTEADPNLVVNLNKVLENKVDGSDMEALAKRPHLMAAAVRLRALPNDESERKEIETITSKREGQTSAKIPKLDQRVNDIQSQIGPLEEGIKSIDAIGIQYEIEATNEILQGFYGELWAHNLPDKVLEKIREFQNKFEARKGEFLTDRAKWDAFLRNDFREFLNEIRFAKKGFIGSDIQKAEKGRKNSLNQKIVNLADKILDVVGAQKPVRMYESVLADIREFEEKIQALLNDPNVSSVLDPRIRASLQDHLLEFEIFRNEQNTSRSLDALEAFINIIYTSANAALINHVDHDIKPRNVGTGVTPENEVVIELARNLSILKTKVDNDLHSLEVFVAGTPNVIDAYVGNFFITPEVNAVRDVLRDLLVSANDDVDVRAFAQKFREVAAQADSNPRLWENFCKIDYPAFAKRVHGKKFSSKEKKNVEAKEKQDSGAKFDDLVRNLGRQVDYLTYGEKLGDKYEKGKSVSIGFWQPDLEDSVPLELMTDVRPSRAHMEMELEAIKVRVIDFGSSNPSITGVKNYLREYAKFLTKIATLNDEDALDEGAKFMHDVYERFVSDVKAKLERKINALKSNTDAVNQSKNQLQAEIQRLGSSKLAEISSAKILEDALGGGVNNAEVRKTKKASEDADNQVKELEKTEKYFADGSGMKEINKLFTKFESEVSGIMIVLGSNGFKERVEQLKGDVDTFSKFNFKPGETEQQRDTSQKLAKARQELHRLEEFEKIAVNLYEKVEALVEHLEGIGQSGPELKIFKDAFKKLHRPGTSSFDPKQFLTLADGIKFLGVDVNIQATIAKCESSLENAEEKAEDAKKKHDEAQEKFKGSKMSDSEAALRLMTHIEKAADPNITMDEARKRATAKLADDVFNLERKAKYTDLLSEKNAKLFDAAKSAAFKRIFENFRYKTADDKVIEPLKGIKIEDLASMEKIEKMFERDQINMEQAFYVLAIMKKLEGGNGRLKQAVELEKKLRDMIGGEIGASENMTDAETVKIVKEAFDAQMATATSRVTASIDYYNEGLTEMKENKKKELNKRFELLKERERRGEIKRKEFKEEMGKLKEEAVKEGLINVVDFSQNSVMTGFWNSSAAQWFRDRGHDLGVYAKEKAKVVGKTAAVLPFKAAAGAVKVATKVGLEAAFAPLKAIKYPFLIAGNVLARGINLFRKKQITPPAVIDAVKKDVGKILGFAVDTAKGAAEGARKAIVDEPMKKWGEVGWKHEKYEERSKKKPEDLKKEAEELAEKAKPAPFKIFGTDVVDLAAYRKRVQDKKKAA